MEIFGDGSMRRDFTYIEDIIDGTLRIGVRPDCFQIVNLGCSQVVELSHLVGLLAGACEKDPKLIHLPPQPGDVYQTYADISKAKRNYGYSPRVEIKQGVEKYVEWVKCSQ